MTHSKFILILMQLRARGYEFGIGDVLDVTSVARSKMGPDGDISGLQGLAPLLSAIICKSADQQRAFRTDWIDICSGFFDVDETQLPEAIAAKREETKARRLARIKIRMWQRWITAAGILAAILIVIVSIALQPEPIVDEGKKTVNTPPDGFSQVPSGSDETAPRAVPLPSTQQLITPSDSPQRTYPEDLALPRAPADATVGERVAAFLQPNWPAVSQIVPIAIMAALFTWLLARFVFSRVAKRANSAKWQRQRVRLGGLRLEGVIEPLMQSVWHRKAIHALRGYRQRETTEIDVGKTVNRAIELNGFTEPVLESVPEIIEYIALFDRRAARDHFTRYAESLVDTLRRADIHVTSGYFSGGLERVWVPDIAADSMTLADLFTHRPHHRILLFAEGNALINTANHEFYPWTLPIKDREDVGILTSAPPADWSVSEWRLRSMGNLVFSADRLGLQSLGSSITTGQMSPPLVLYEVSGIPRGLVETSARWKQSQKPPRRAVRQLTAELRNCLGEDGFKWLCATAIYPVLNWELTIFLGSRIVRNWSRDGLLVERRLLDICRMPWFRTGVMPAWLRWHLIGFLSKAERDEIRGQLACLIDAAQRSDDPDAPRIDISEVPESAPLIDTEEIEAFLEPEVQGALSDFRDYIFSNTLRGRHPRKFEARLPRSARSAVASTLDNAGTIAAVAFVVIFLPAWIALAPTVKDLVDTTVRERRDEVLTYTNAQHRVWLLSQGQSGEPQDYSGRDLSNVNWTGQGPLAQLILDDANLSGANLEALNLSNASLVGADLSGVNLSNAALIGVDFTNATLIGADLSDTDLTEASLFNADATDLILGSSNASGANLATQDDLRAEQLEFVCGDAATQIPSGITLIPCIDESSLVTLTQTPSVDDEALPDTPTIPSGADLISRPKSDTQIDILARGTLTCGVTTGLLGFAAPDASGNWQGFDVDFCRAMAAAILGDRDAVDFVPTTGKTRFTALASGEVDILARNTAWTFSRDVDLKFNYVGINFYDGQGFMVPKSLGVSSAKDLNGATVCVQLGTLTELNLADFFRINNISYEPVPIETSAEAQQQYLAGACDVLTQDISTLAATRAAFENPEDHVILPEIVTKEPLGPIIRRGDVEFTKIAQAVLNVLILSEEYNVTQANVVDLSAGSTSLQFNALASMGAELGLPSGYATRVIAAVGNYAEIFARNLGPTTPMELERGLNANWRDGGLMYGFPPLSSDFEDVVVPNGLRQVQNLLNDMDLSAIQGRGEIRCGVISGRSGYAREQVNRGDWSGAEVDLCKAIAAAVFNDPDAVSFIELSAIGALEMLMLQNVDLIPGGIRWTAPFDALDYASLAAVNDFDGTAFLIPKALAVNTAKELDGANVCLPPGGIIEQDVVNFFDVNNISFQRVPILDLDEGVKAYFSGACDTLPANVSDLLQVLLIEAVGETGQINDHGILPERLSLYPTGPVVAGADGSSRNSDWVDIVRWVTNALIAAEELGITQENVQQIASSGSNDFNVDLLLGNEGTLGEMMGLDADWAVRAIAAVGNYGEIYERNFGSSSLTFKERSLSANWTNGGLLYSPPFR